MKRIERRETFRMPFDSTVSCHILGSGKKINGPLRDISILGLFLETDHKPEPGCRCNLEILVESKHSRLRIEDVDGAIVRRDEEGIAIRFDERLEWFAMVTLCSYKQKELLP